LNKKLNVADYVIDFFSKKKIKHVFLVPGGGNMYLVNSIKTSNKIRYSAFFHEQSAAIASESYSRITENIGVCCVTSGPGSTNAITGVVGSWIESIPLIIISGQVKTKDLTKKNDNVRQTGPQEVDIISMVKKITKYSKTIKKNEQIPYELNKAYEIATTGRKGPVWLDIPLDVQASYISKNFKLIKKKIKIKEQISKKNINKIKNLLFNSKRPIIYVGHGLRLSGGVSLFKKFINNSKIPFVTSWLAIDTISSDHPLNQGRPGVVARRYSNFAIQNCDLLICIGARINEINTAFNIKEFSKLSRKIIVDIDSNELKKIKLKNTTKIKSDAKNFLKNLINIRFKKPSYRDWIKHLHLTKIKYKKEILYKKEKKLSHYEVINKLSSIIPSNYFICTGSSGFGTEVFYTHFQNKKNQRILLTSGLGSMGYALPSAIGTCVANKFKNNICCVETDGSLMFNIQELATISSYKMPIKIILLNNNGYASIRATQKNFFKGNYVGTGPEDGIKYPDFSKLCDSFKIKYFKISKISDFSKIQKNLYSKKAIFFDIIIRREEALLPKVRTIINKKGKINSMPLEDLYPLLSINDLQKELLFPVKKSSIIARNQI
jgi:acetolactate synthase-1/2/3 large subunit